LIRGLRNRRSEVRILSGALRLSAACAHLQGVCLRRSDQRFVARTLVSDSDRFSGALFAHLACGPRWQSTTTSGPTADRASRPRRSASVGGEEDSNRGHHDFQAVVDERFEPQRACKSATSGLRCQGAIPLVLVGLPRVRDSAEGLKSQTPCVQRNLADTRARGRRRPKSKDHGAFWEVDVQRALRQTDQRPPGCDPPALRGETGGKGGRVPISREFTVPPGKCQGRLKSHPCAPVENAPVCWVVVGVGAEPSPEGEVERRRPPARRVVGGQFSAGAVRARSRSLRR
jgi:hypothetical protein